MIIINYCTLKRVFAVLQSCKKLFYYLLLKALNFKWGLGRVCIQQMRHGARHLADQFWLLTAFLKLYKVVCAQKPQNFQLLASWLMIWLSYMAKFYIQTYSIIMIIRQIFWMRVKVNLIFRRMLATIILFCKLFSKAKFVILKMFAIKLLSKYSLIYI